MNRLRFLLSLASAALLASPLSVMAGGTHSKGKEPIHVMGGDPINLADYLVPGKTTIFDFYSDYCPPCMRIAPRMEKLHETRDDVAVVKVNINRPDIKGIDWDSPVARQYGLQSIPHFKIFSPDGKLVAEGDEAYDKVLGMLN
jgi:thiol-disulfide isomerase/thioredoxin